jgi:hypothetical protein
VNACKNIRHVDVGLEEHGEVPSPEQRTCEQQC